MLSIRRPTPASVQDFLATQAKLSLTYAAVGSSLRTPPAGYVVDHTRVRLGAGERAFDAARAALAHWEHFRLGWLEAIPNDTPIERGQVVGILARSLGVWSLNACRIVAVIDEDGSVKRFGFSYGTLPGHMESGEERFLIEWQREEDGVWYDILAFSRPRHFLARLSYPWMRRMQKRFGQESAAAMCRAVREAAGISH